MAKENINIEKALTDDERVEMFLSKHWLKVLAAVVILLIAGVVAYTIYHNKQESIREATIALANAEVEKLPELLQQNPDVPGAAFARLRLAHHQVEKKQYTEAAENFLAFASDPAAPVELASRARLSAGACKEYAGKNDEAVQIYLGVYNAANSTSAIRNEAAFQAAKLYIAKKDNAKAKELLTSVVNAKFPAEQQQDPAIYSAMQWQGLCQMMLNSIE